MNTTFCTYEGSRDEMIVAYLYEDIEPAARSAFESHIAGCAVCREEIAELRVMRTELARWAPPGPARVFTFPASTAPRRSRVWSALAEIPAWAQVAAALLVLGIAAGIANVEVKYDRAGFAVRTGWMATDAASAAGGSFSSGVTPDLKVGPTDASTAAQPWRADLTALERQLRAELQTAKAEAVKRGGPEARSDADLLRRVRALIEESERNQRRELALRVAEVAREGQAQRIADLQRIQRGFNALENTTGGAILRQGVLLNNLAVKVSQQQ
jgi:hypothetical protein